MTVTNTDSSKRFHGGGTTGPFTWLWRFLDNDEIKVFRIAEPNEANPALEVRELLGVGDYTLTGAGSYTGGSLTLATALAVGADLLIERRTVATQEVSIRNQGNSFRPSVHEEIFDRLTMLAQDRDREIDTHDEQITNHAERLVFAEATIAGLVAGVGAAVYVVDATVIPKFVDLPGANDPAARAVIVVKSQDDTTTNSVTVRPATGTVEGLYGAVATFDITMSGGGVMLVPCPEENHYYQIGFSPAWLRLGLMPEVPRVVDVSGPVLPTDRFIVIDATLGAVELTFLSAVSATAIKVARKRSDPGTYAATLTAAVGETLGGAASLTLLPGEGYEFVPDGTSDFIQL